MGTREIFSFCYTETLWFPKPPHLWERLLSLAYVDLGATKASGYHTWLIPSVCFFLKVNKQSEVGGRGEQHGSTANYLWLWVSCGWSLHQARTWKNVSGSVARWVASPYWSFPPEPLPDGIWAQKNRLETSAPFFPSWCRFATEENMHISHLSNHSSFHFSVDVKDEKWDGTYVTSGFFL